MSVVYFIQSGKDGPIKIGVASDLARRVRQLSCASAEPLVVLATLPGSRSLELRLHRALHASKKRLEWFNPTPEVRAVAILSKHRGLEPVERWLDVKSQEVELRPSDFIASDDFGKDIRELSAMAVRHAVARHGKDVVAEVMGRSVDRVEIWSRTGSNIPVTSWLNLCVFDPGACAPVFARAGDLPVWLGEEAIDKTLGRLGPREARA